MTFSVVIPTFNRPEQLRLCLAALAGVSYPADHYEVIVVDDGGSVELDPIVAPFYNLMNVRLMRRRNGGPGSARNEGAAHATGRFIAFTDDDCEPDANWLTALGSTLESKPEALVGGRVINGLPNNVCAVASQRIVDHFVSHYNSDPESARFFPSNNIAVATGLFLQAGGFDRSFGLAGGEDREFCDRWLARGVKLAMSPDAFVVHRHDMGLRGFWRQHFVYGRGAFLYSAARRRRGAAPVPFEGWPLHLGLLTGPTLKLAVLACLSQTAVATGYLCQWLASGRLIDDNQPGRNQSEEE